MYMACLEAHVKDLHKGLSERGLWPIETCELERLNTLNNKVAKVGNALMCCFASFGLTICQSMVAGLQNDTNMFRLQLLELERIVRISPPIYSRLTPPIDVD